MKSIFNRVRCSKGNSEVKTRIEIYAKKYLPTETCKNDEVPPLHKNLN